MLLLESAELARKRETFLIQHADTTVKTQRENNPTKMRHFTVEIEAPLRLKEAFTLVLSSPQGPVGPNQTKTGETNH